MGLRRARFVAHPWGLERRNGLTRRIYNRRKDDDRFSGEQIFSGVQWRLTSMIPASGRLASELVFGSDPVDLYGWDDQAEDSLCARDISALGQSVQRWKLRMMAPEAAS